MPLFYLTNARDHNIRRENDRLVGSCNLSHSFWQIYSINLFFIITILIQWCLMFFTFHLIFLLSIQYIPFWLKVKGVGMYFSYLNNIWKDTSPPATKHMWNPILPIHPQYVLDHVHCVFPSTQGLFWSFTSIFFVLSHQRAFLQNVMCLTVFVFSQSLYIGVEPGAGGNFIMPVVMLFRPNALTGWDTK